MYLPSAFRQDDLAELHAQMQASPFALLTSSIATPAPPAPAAK